MNTNEKETNNYLNRLVYIGVLLILFLIPKVKDYFTYKPKLWYEPSVAETGNYLSAEENFYVTDEDQIHMGDRYLLSCKLSHTPEETKNGYMYSFVEDISKNAAIITGLMLQEQNYQGNLRFLGFSNCSIDINYRGGHTWFITITVLQLRCVRHFYSYSPLGPVKDWLREIAKMYNKDPMYFEEPVEYLFQ